jgi:hopanoid C-3 methylase
MYSKEFPLESFKKLFNKLILNQNPMKILLIRPPVPKHTIGLKNIMICEPLELEYVGAGLKGHDVQILDLIIEKGLKKRLNEFQPDMVGTSSYISGVNEVIKICREVKRWNKKCLTVVGGVQAAQVPEDYIDNSVDIILRGDGTTQMAKVLEAYEKGEDLTLLPNLSFPEGSNKLFSTKVSAYMPPADELPLPDRNLIEHLKHRYYYLMHKPVVTMKTAWGCWYKCNFCYTWRVTDGIPYARSPESIVKELLTIDATEVYIVDDIFLIKPSRLRKLADLLRENKIKKNYLVYARSDFIAQNEEIIKEWAELGLKAVFIGLEAVTDTELSNMNKENSVDMNLQGINVLQKYGVDIYGSLIPHPDYTIEDWERLRNFIEKTGLYYLNISPLMPLPGTVIWKEFENKVTVPRNAHGLWDLSHTLLKTKLPLKQYYWQLLKTYATVMYNFPRAQKVTYRTLPSIWSVQYLKIIIGSAKIGWQFLNAHRHHTKKELKKAMYCGEPVHGLDYSVVRLGINTTEEKSVLQKKAVLQN